MRTGMYFNDKKCTREAAYSAARNPPRVVVVVVAAEADDDGGSSLFPRPLVGETVGCVFVVSSGQTAGLFLPRFRASREGVVRSRSCTDLLSSQLPARLYSVQTGPIHAVQLGGPSLAGQAYALSHWWIPAGYGTQRARRLPSLTDGGEEGVINSANEYSSSNLPPT